MNVESKEFLIVSLVNRFKGSSYPFQMSLYLFGYFFFMLICMSFAFFFEWSLFVCFFRFLFCENPFDAIVFDFMSRIFQRFFPVCLFISFRKMLFWIARQNMRLKIFWRQQLWHNKMERDTKFVVKIRKECQLAFLSFSYSWEWKQFLSKIFGVYLHFQ